MRSLLEAANTPDRETFVARFGHVFERSPWVAASAWVRRPFASIDALHEAMMAVVLESPRASQLALLRAHPELWGEEARRGAMTPASVAEQASAGLTDLPGPQAARIARLNAAHRARFGFPFILAVRGHARAEVFAEFERRLALDPQAALDESLRQVAVITRLRLDDLAAN